MIKFGLGIDDAEEEIAETVEDSNVPPLEDDEEDVNRMEEVD